MHARLDADKYGYLGYTDVHTMPPIDFANNGVLGLVLDFFYDRP